MTDGADIRSSTNPQPHATQDQGDQQHRFTVTVTGCTAEQAQQVMTERLGHDEDYGFEYRLDWTAE